MRIFVYSNLSIVACALLMVNQSSLLLLHTTVDPDLAGFVGFSTLCSYSFHYYLTFHSVIPSARIEWVHKNRWVHDGSFGGFIPYSRDIKFFTTEDTELSTSQSNTERGKLCATL